MTASELIIIRHGESAGTRVQDDKIAAIRQLAEARQELATVRAEAAQKLAELERATAAEISAAERDDARLYTAATKAGWSPEELLKIGFDTPAKQRRTPRRTKRGAVRHATPEPPEPA